MVKKVLDSRVPTLIRNCIQANHRSLILIVGDRQKDVIVNLYHILLNIDIRRNKSVLWAYKSKLLGFTSHRKKREKKIRKEIKRGIRDVNQEDPFQLFVSTQDIRYVYYKETEKILGNTYAMCILQDFEALTPNLLARTMETVEGGGLILVLLKEMKSLKQLYVMSMDIHARYRTEAHHDVVSRFNERFILSLGSCKSCLVIDDEMNVLPISGGRMVEPLPPLGPDTGELSGKSLELKELKLLLANETVIGPLLQLTKTLDQAKALQAFVEAIAAKTLQSTISLTAARGRGKSAAMGLAVAAAVAHGYSNIFITSPSPENLKTLFEFVFKGFDALEYLDHTDYSILQSTNPEFNKAIVRVNIYRNHRQTIQYIRPQDAYTLGQAELLIIDEAAAIPLPLVKKLLGSYLIFMASTINGYEGTGRSLSLKLIKQLRQQSSGIAERNQGVGTDKIIAGGSGTRNLQEVFLSDPIRYAEGDPVEAWLNSLLCLDATLNRPGLGGPSVQHPSKCQLLWVNRDTLFSYHPVSEAFLQHMMALYVASHYKNSPNDLQLMSDAPAHQLFVLVGPISDDADSLPVPLCVLQVALEGKISQESVYSSLRRGQRPSGDLIPWLISQQYQDCEFAGLSGARIVRVATHPDYMGMGYGSRAIQLLIEFYSGKLADLSEPDKLIDPPEMLRISDTELEVSTLLQDNIKVRDIHSMPPLFIRLSRLRPFKVDYVGVSYGLMGSLHKFWKREGFVPIYLRLTTNELTGEHTCVMLRSLESSDLEADWLANFSEDFHRRYLSLLSYQFREFSSVFALSIEESVVQGYRSLQQLKWNEGLTNCELNSVLSPFDVKRLDSYANNVLDYHVILDLMPTVARLFFEGKLRHKISLSGVQSCILMGVGLQRKTLDDLEGELGLEMSQLLAMLVKILRKFSQYFRSIEEKAVRVEEDMDVDAIGENPEMPAHDAPSNVLDKNAAGKLNRDLADGAASILNTERQKLQNMIDIVPSLEEICGVRGEDLAWDEVRTESQMTSRIEKHNEHMRDRTPDTISVRRLVEPIAATAMTNSTKYRLKSGGKKHVRKRSRV